MRSPSAQKLLIGGVLFHALVALLNLCVDYWILSGPDGLVPDEGMVSGFISDYSLSNRLKYWPTMLYWFEAEYVLGIGILASLIGIVIISFTPRVMFSRILCGVVYLCLLSFSNSRGVLLWFPWDCLLFECLVLCTLVPQSEFTIKLLLFRVMFGFGKHKFLGAHELNDLTYTSSMACWQPLGSNLGWWLTFLPLWVHIPAIAFIFVVEIVCPVYILFGTGKSVRVSCVLTIGLMVMIQLTGHFGWFNTLTAFLAVIAYLDSLCDIPKIVDRNELKKGRHPSLGSIKTAYCIICIIFFIPSQWNSPAMFYQHTFDCVYFDVVRVASSWRLVHTYGVFPPKKMPMIKPVGRFSVEVINNGSTEEPLIVPLEYHYQLSVSTSQSGFFPMSVAPFRFPRFDYIYGFYAGSHVWSLVTRLGPLVGDGEEYIDGVARMLLNRPDLMEQYFKISKSSLLREIRRVFFSVVGLVPTSAGWEEVSVQVSKEWTKSDFDTPRIELPVSYSIPLSSVVLRKASVSFQKTGGDWLSPPYNAAGGKYFAAHALLNEAIRIVDSRGRKDEYSVGLLQKFLAFEPESQWLQKVVREYDRLVQLSDNSTMSIFGFQCGPCSPGDAKNILWNLCPSAQFGGYIGCLTFVHLVPYPVHSPLCPLVMAFNRDNRLPSGSQDDRYSKIPIDPIVYWLMGMSSGSEVSVSR